MLWSVISSWASWLSFTNAAVAVVVITIAYNLSRLFPKSPIMSHENTRMRAESPARRAYGDELLQDRRLRPLYRKLKQSLNWVKDYQKKKHEGDGLNSIFKPAADFELTTFSFSRAMEHTAQGKGSNLTPEAKMAFEALMGWGLFQDKDIQFILELARSAQSVDLVHDTEQKLYVFEEADECTNWLYILQEGSCMATATYEGGNEHEIYPLRGGAVLSSLIHFIAFLTQAPCQRGVSVRCETSCKLLRIPDPSSLPIFQKSQSYFKETIARILRVVLTRLNRVTIFTAYFYLGLAYEVFPSFEGVNIPVALQTMCTDGIVTKDAVLLIKQVVGEVLGVSEDDIPGAQNVDDIIEEGSALASSILRPNFVTGASNFVVDSEDEDIRNESNSKQRPKIRKRTPRHKRELQTPAPGAKTPQEEVEIPGPLPLLRSSSGPAFDAYPSRVSSIGEDNQFDAAPQIERPLRLLCVPKGKSLLDCDDTPSLYVVITGTLSLSFSGFDQSASHGKLFLSNPDKGSVMLHAGAVIGQLSLVTGSSEEWYGNRRGARPTLEAHAVTDTWLVKISRSCHELIQRSHPEVLIHLSKRVCLSIPTVLKIFDFGTAFKQMKAGEVLVRAGDDKDDALYVVIHGRLRGTICDDKATSDRRERSVDEFSRGTLIGDTELLNGEPYRMTVRAMRHCALARVPESVIACIVRKYPSVLSHLAVQVSRKQSRVSDTSFQSSRLTRGIGGMGQPKTVMLVPVSGSVPLDLFSRILKAALTTVGCTAKVLTSTYVTATLGLDYDVDDQVPLTIGSWMHLQEEQNEMCIYQADWHGGSAWNRLCCSQCDLILLVANSTDSPQINSAEQELYEGSRHVPKVLVMLHVNPTPSYRPKSTRKWVEQRTGIQMQLQLRVHTHNLWFDTQHFKSDFTRLARMLTGCAVGLVLGGGGARGLCHLGALKALEEQNVPVDVIGGTSFGAFVGALYGEEDRYLDLLPRATKFARRMGNVWNYIRDLTLPITAYFHGEGFNHEIRSAIGDSQKIEDLWLPYFCVTTDLTKSTERVHVNGTLWRYVRASMGLAGYLPPICDVSENGTVHYLVDGGYVNNLPADVMKEVFGVRTVIAVDVSGEWTLKGQHDYGDMISGMYVFFNNLLPFRKSINVPSMADISTQLAYVSAVRQIEQAKSRFVDLYLIPPVNQYTVFDFQKMPEILNIGYTYCSERIAEWKSKLCSSEESKQLARVLFGSGARVNPLGLSRVWSFGLIASDDENLPSPRRPSPRSPLKSPHNRSSSLDTLMSASSAHQRYNSNMFGSLDMSEHLEMEGSDTHTHTQN